jgi:tetratricopeptide (TPR) repeat protein
LLRDAAAGFGSAGDLWGQALALLLLGEMRGVDGSDPVAGRIAFEQTLTIARTLGVASLEGIALARLGNAMVQEGDIAAAERLHDEAIAIGRRLAYPPLMALSQNSIAARLRRQGQLDEANAAAQEALELYRGVGHGTAPDGKVHMDAPEGAALALVMLGLVAGDRRELETAKEHHTRALAVAQRTIDPVVIAIALEGLARTAALQSEGAEAAMLLGHARALREAALTSYSTFEDDVAEARRTALDLLGRDAYDAAFEQGHRSELGDVMSFSLYL